MSRLPLHDALQRCGHDKNIRRLALERGQAVLQLIVGGGLYFEIGVDSRNVLANRIGCIAQRRLHRVLGRLPVELGHISVQVLCKNICSKLQVDIRLTSIDNQILVQLVFLVFEHLSEVCDESSSDTVASERD